MSVHQAWLPVQACCRCKCKDKLQAIHARSHMIEWSCRYYRGGRTFAGTVLEREILPADWLCSWSQNLTRNLLHLKVRCCTMGEPML